MAAWCHTVLLLSWRHSSSIINRWCIGKRWRGRKHFSFKVCFIAVLLWWGVSPNKIYSNSVQQKYLFCYGCCCCYNSFINTMFVSLVFMLDLIMFKIRSLQWTWDTCSFITPVKRLKHNLGFLSYVVGQFVFYFMIFQPFCVLSILITSYLSSWGWTYFGFWLSGKCCCIYDSAELKV